VFLDAQVHMMGGAGIKKNNVLAERSYKLDSGGQTGEWALVQEEQMGPLLTPGKNFTKQIKRDNKH